MTERTAYRLLKRYVPCLTRQQVKTLTGQIKAGYCEDAMRGLATILGIRKETKP